MALTIDVKTQAFYGLVEKLRKKGRKLEQEYLQKASRIVVEEMRRQAPRKTGRLQKSIRVFRFGNSVKILPTVSYAVFVEKGVKPHEIKPKKAKVLRFEVGGEEVFARRVSHPGFSGTFFVRKTGEIIRPRLRELLLKLVYER